MAFALAPEPAKQLDPKTEYGDYPTALRTQRTLIQQYNATVPANLRTQSRNRDEIVRLHNEKVVKSDEACDLLWKAYNEQVLKQKESKAEKKLSRSLRDIF